MELEDDLSDEDRARLHAGNVMRYMLDRTLDMWRLALDGDEEITMVAAVMTVVVDVEGVGVISVCNSHPADEPEKVIKAATETAELLAEVL